jgi:LasA protease
LINSTQSLNVDDQSLEKKGIFARWALVIVFMGLLGINALLLMGCRREADLAMLDAPPGGKPAAATSTAIAVKQTQAVHSPTVIPNTPTSTPTRVPPETTAVYYTIRPGDNLLRIAIAYGTTVEMLTRLNNIGDADQLRVGDVLQISMDAQYESPDELLIPDSELVYGPGYEGFDIADATAGYGGYFNEYTEVVHGRTLTASEIVDLVAREYSVGPRVLLALLELRGEWLSRSNLEWQQIAYPLGFDRGEGWQDLYYQLCLAADSLNAGFYGWWGDTSWLIQVRDGTYVQYSTQINAGTAGIQRMLAQTANSYESWIADIEAFQDVYHQAFGSPFDYAVEPLISGSTDSIELALPWQKGETWYYTGGPHPGWGTQGAFAAIDFATDEKHIGCAISNRWVTASAPGTVLVSEDGMVLQDTDSDGFLGTGWVLSYMHIAADGRAEVGDQLEIGDKIGHPSCEGGISSASHLHFARRLNGVWIDAEDPNWPMNLSGWIPASSGVAYEGTLTRKGTIKTACECWNAINAVDH